MTRPMADGKYCAILLDCPWDPKPYSAKGKGRHPSAYYDVMNLDEIKSLPVKDYAAKDCWVFCWTTDQFLNVASYELPPAWGYKYSSVAFSWFKTAKRLGRQLPLFLIADNKEFPMGRATRHARSTSYVCSSASASQGSRIRAYRTPFSRRGVRTARSPMSNTS